MQDFQRVLSAVNPATVTGAFVYAGLFALAGLVGTLFIRSAARRVLRHDSADQMAVAFLRPVTQILMWAVLAVMYLHLIPVLRAVGTALLAGASVASIVLGVAAQNTLGNAIAGLALLVYRPFRVGDRVLVQAPGGAEVGIVENVTLGYTVLRTFDNRRVVLPNSLAGTQTMINLTSVDPKVMATVRVGISYTADVAQAREILLGIAKAHADVVATVDCPLVDLGSSSVTLLLRAWCQDSVSVKRLEYDVLEQAKDRFAQAGIEIPYPYQNVILTRTA